VTELSAEHGLYGGRAKTYAFMGEEVNSPATDHCLERCDSSKTFATLIGQTRSHGQVQKSIFGLCMVGIRATFVSNCLHLSVHHIIGFYRPILLRESNHRYYWLATFCSFNYRFDPFNQQFGQFVSICESSKNSLRYKQRHYQLYPCFNFPHLPYSIFLYL